MSIGTGKMVVEFFSGKFSLSLQEALAGGLWDLTADHICSLSQFFLQTWNSPSHGMILGSLLPLLLLPVLPMALCIFSGRSTCLVSNQREHLIPHGSRVFI